MTKKTLTPTANSKKPTSNKKKPATSKGRSGSKSAQVIDLLERSCGASIQEMMKATGWQAHSVRGFMAGTLKKKGRIVTSDVNESGLRHYRLAMVS